MVNWKAKAEAAEKKLAEKNMELADIYDSNNSAHENHLATESLLRRAEARIEKFKRGIANILKHSKTMTNSTHAADPTHQDQIINDLNTQAIEIETALRRLMGEKTK